MIHTNENMNQKNTDLLHVDFDELLQEFSKSHSPETEEPDHRNGQTFIYQNESYTFSKEKESCSYSLTQLEITSEHFMANGKNLSQYYLLNDKLPGSIQTYLCLDDFSSDREFPLQIFLYKVGNPNPLAGCVVPSLYQEPMIFLDRSFEPGRYFLFFPGASVETRLRGMTELDEGLCYGFDLLQRYDRFRPFDMGDKDRLQLDWARKLTAHSWHLETLELQSGLCREENVPVEISAFCYTDDLTLVSKTSVCRKQLRFPVFQFKPKVPWMKGTYHIVLEVNSFPLATVDFDIRDSGEIEYVHYAELAQSDLFFKLVHEMEYNPVCLWNYLSKQEGLGNDRRKLLHLHCSRQRAERARHQRDSELMLIVSPCENKTIELVAAMEPILKTGREEVCYIDLEKLEDCRQQWEAFKDDSERMNRTFIFYHPMAWMERDGCMHAAMQRLFAAPHEGVTMVLCLSVDDCDCLKVVRKNVKERMDGEESFDIHRCKVLKQDLQLEAFFQTDRRGVCPARMPRLLDRSEFDAAMHELNGMVGLDSLKQGLRALFQQLQFCRMRTSLGLPNLKEMPRHMIFTGNPGTGKTMVAKLIGRIYRSLGILSDGGTLVTQRSKLVGQYIGQTEMMMEDFLASAKGKVVFIDEAYSLFTDSSDRRDAGYRVVETLLPVLSDPDSNIVFILAGYKREMDDLMKANAGLASRFPLSYEFKDYSAEELFQMVVGRLDKGKYVLTEAALTALREYIDRAVAAKE